MIPLFTILWGISGILAYFLNQDSAIYHESTYMEKLTLMIRLFSINIVHWIFVIKYYRTSLMLPKIFHDIMIDDFIEHGKFVQMSGSENGSNQMSLQKSSSESENSSMIFDVSEYGQFGQLRVERAKLHKIAKDHQESIKKLDHRLNILNYLVVAIYSLLQIMIWFYPILSEPVFAILMFISWIMFLTAMSRINKTLSNL